MEKFKLAYSKIKKWFYTKILDRKYYRTGSCKMCGRCCEKIYVKHGANVLKDEEIFKKLQPEHEFYQGLTVVGADEVGLIFSCNHLDKETRLCTIHKKREAICRNYPQEELFAFGGSMSEDCGYKFEPIISFEEVFSKVSKDKTKDFEVL